MAESDGGLRESDTEEIKPRTPFSGNILSTRTAALLAFLCSGVILAAGKWLASGPLLGLL